MAQLLTLSRAARLVGVTRGALQKKIKDGELDTFEGMVRTQDLLGVYPDAQLEDNALIERLTQLKDGAFARRLRERILPDPEVLAVRLADIGRELAVARVELSRYRAATRDLDEQLTAFAESLPEAARAALEALHRRLRAALESAPEDREHHLLAVKDSFMRVMVAHVLVLPSQREFFVEGRAHV